MNDLVPLPVAIPFCAAAFLMATSVLLSRRVRDLIAIATAGVVTAICVLLLLQSANGSIVYWFGGWQPRDGVALGISFVIDPLGAALAALSAGLTMIAFIFSWRYFDEIGALYPTLMLIFMGAMAGFCLTGDLFNLFVFFELMSVTAYALTGYKIEEKQSLMGAFNFGITNSVGAFLMLIGIGLLYGRTGALNLAQLGQTLATGRSDGLVITALTLVTTGLGVKAALAPFQFWLADAHAAAPTPVCVLFSGVMVELGLYGVARVYWTVFAGAVAPAAADIRGIWVGLGVLTALIGGLMCFAERHLKRLLAFSTISHTGLFLLGVGLLTPDGLAGSAVYILGHAAVKGALFLGAGILLNRFGSVDENELHGAGRRFPWLGVLFLTGGLALSGLPPFATSLGKSLIEESAGKLGYAWLKPVMLIASALTGGAVLRATGQIFLGLGTAQNRGAQTPKREEKETDETYDRPPAVMFLPVVALLVLALLAGLSPKLERQTREAASRFEDQQSYVATVLAVPIRAPAPPAVATSPRLPGILSGLETVGLALIFALVALFRQSIPKTVGVLAARLGGPPIAILRRLHSGQAADYITWLTLGVGVVGSLFACFVRS